MKTFQRMENQYRCVLNAAKEGEVYLYGDIGDSFWGGVSADQLRKDVKALGDVKRLHVRINSNGGDVFQGVAMYNLLRNQRAEVVTYVDGLAASAASVVMLAGDRREIGEGGFVMVHRPWGMVAGNEDDLRAYADTLVQIGESMVSLYASRTGLAEADVRAMMAGETWLDAGEAVAKGFATKQSEFKAAASVDAGRFMAVPAALAGRTPPEDVARRARLASMRRRLDTGAGRPRE